jgi:DNA replication protein DnaC
LPLSRIGAELLFETFSLRYERLSMLITSNLLFEERTETFGSERLTGALLGRINLCSLNLFLFAQHAAWHLSFPNVI